MIWSFVKILVFVLVVIAATLGVMQLLETSGEVRISVANTEFTLTPLVAVVGLALTLFAFWVALKLINLLIAVFRFLNGDETAISRYFDRSRERKGFEALADGMMALASGEGKTAMAKASKAEKYLKRPELTNLIAAQAAEQSGDTRKAQEVYKRLLKDDRTRFVGVRGIMKQRLAEGDTETALKLAEKAFAIKPKHENTQDVLLKLQAEKEDWAGTRKTLNAKLKYGTLPRDVHKRRDAVLALAEGKELLSSGDDERAYQHFIEANRLSPDLIPAAAMAARAYVAQGKARNATKAIKKAWDSLPHPDLAAAFAEIAPDEAPQARIKRFATLTRGNPQHPESRMLTAELHIAAEDFPAARRALGDLVETDPTTRSLTIMAAIERGEGSDDAVVRGWLAKAVTAKRGPQWICDITGKAYPEWVPSTEGGFDTLSWVEPKEEASSLGGAEMLPLIVGALENKAEPSDEAESADIVDAEPVEAEDATAAKS